MQHNLKMSTTEVEDLASLVGIEILPEGSSSDQKQGEELPVVNSEISDKRATTAVAYSADILAMCSSESLTALEEEFAGRFTPQDAEFAKTLATPTHSPPCISPWWSNDKQDRGDRFRGRGRGQGWGRGQYDRREDNSNREGHRRSEGYQNSWNRDDNRSGHHGNWGRRDDSDRRQYRDRSPDRRHRY